MAGHLDLGHDGDEAILRERDHLARGGLRVRAAGGARGQLGMRADREAEALVVGQVPVEDVEPVEREEVDVALDEILVEEMPGDVEVHRAVAIRGSVLDVEARERGNADVGRGRRERDRSRARELRERLGRIEQPCRMARMDERAVGGDVERVRLVVRAPRRLEGGVALRGRGRRIEPEHDGVGGPRLAGSDGAYERCTDAQPTCETQADRPRGRMVVDHDPAHVTDGKAPSASDRGPRSWHERERRERRRRDGCIVPGGHVRARTGRVARRAAGRARRGARTRASCTHHACDGEHRRHDLPGAQDVAHMTAMSGAVCHRLS